VVEFGLVGQTMHAVDERVPGLGLADALQRLRRQHEAVLRQFVDAL
jgi:hypothetical protein